MRRTVVVVDVFDGNSFRVSSGRTVVLDGVPCPELLSLPGRRARQRLEELLLHRHVQFEGTETDERGRMRVRVWADGEDINAAMLRFGREQAQPAPAESRPARKIDIPVSGEFLKSGTDGMSSG